MSNSTSGRSVDPRFDPAFQPGYDPQSDPVRAARVPSYTEMSDSARLQPGAVIEPPRARYTTEPTVRSDNGQTPVAVEIDSAAPSRLLESEAAQPVSLRRNPFLIALWVIGVILFVMGAYLAQQLLDPESVAVVSAAGGSPISYFAPQLLVFGAPLLMVLGIATLCSALCIHAVRWRARG